MAENSVQKQLRWGKRTVQRLDLEEGNVVVISGAIGDPVKEHMADALQQALDALGRSGEVAIIIKPNRIGVSEISPEQMNQIGWYHESQLTDDALKSPETNHS